ncbi:hypothetical protein OSTOST_22901 [Ostertagia ostertagi]
MTPMELISELAKGNFNSDSASYEDDDASEDRSVPPSQRLSLRIAQSLTLAANYDHTFSVEQLAARDLTHRNTLSDLIIPHVLNPIEDNKEFVDILAHYNITINYIKLICATATAETATGFLTLKKINSAIARLHNITLESSLPAESIDLNDIPTIEDMHAVTGGPIPISPTPLEPETKSIPKSAPATASTELHIRSSTSVTTTAHSSTPQQVTVSVAPNDSLSASVCSSSQDRGSTRTVRTVRAVAVSRSPSAHSDKRKQKPAKKSPSPSSSRKQSQEKQPTPDLVCHFCKATGAHFSAGCPNIKSLSDRAITAVSDGKCLYCLKAHSPGYCKRDIPCRLCDSTEHHPALCPYSHYIVRDIGPDVDKFFSAMYVIYENYHRHH